MLRGTGFTARFVFGQDIRRRASDSLVAVRLAVLLSLSFIALGTAQGSGIDGIRAEMHMAQDAAVDSVLHVLPPLGATAGGVDDLDPTLVNFLKVTICEPGGGGICTTVREFTFQKTPGGGLDYIIFQSHHYHVNWDVAKSEVGKGLEIHFTVAGLEIGHIAYSPATGRTVPIKFRIANHPRIRARVMRDQGFTATEIATVLRNEFGLNEDEIGEILLAENFSCVEIGEAVIIVFDLDAWQGAARMKGFGCSAREAYDALMFVFNIQDEILIEKILFAAGYKMEEFIDFTAIESVRRFAPVLYFDRAHKGLPMSAQLYFDTMMFSCVVDPVKETIAWTAGWDGPPVGTPGTIQVPGRDEQNTGMHNNAFSKLENGEVPTYYKVISDIDSDVPTGPKGRLRIAYWWFYGYQQYCNPLALSNPGEHHGDWEFIWVTTDPSRSKADAVTYCFHGVWYTRKSGGFDTEGDRPVVYVGKLGHGNYHNDDHSGWMVGTPHHCCHYADYKNETEDSIWRNAGENLVSLRGNSEPWMFADRIGSTFTYNSHEYEVAHWRWGPHISYCDDWFFVCVNWTHVDACGTHPTADYPLDWDKASCKDEGCRDHDCSGLVYTSPLPDYNQGWPWGSGLLTSATDGPEGSGSSDFAGADPSQVCEASLTLSTANPCVEAVLAGTFSMPRALVARLSVYDVRGRLISGIVNQRVEPGMQMFEWDLRKTSGSRVTPGIYFLRLETPDRSITRKIVIQR
ncbi:T9SS type A sorting domain-containing protein [Candidatus Eisenbacteria bacterium]|uniref:T9SS type A sorting domain-containing protein n=1 Tax=Eiseniibacteriota bacterium TaxID=2212470 RepID=A0ABV6YN27_UNCEI